MAQSRREKKQQMRFLTFWAIQKIETRILKLFKKKSVVLSIKPAMNVGKKKKNFFSPTKCAHRNQFSTQDALKGPTRSETIF
jgi:hypothetical protein